MKTFWVKVVLRDGRGKLVGPTAHLFIHAPSADEAVKDEIVTYAEDRVWAHLPTDQHGYCRLQTLAVETTLEEANHG
jgi:hypothetical protein